MAIISRVRSEVKKALDAGKIHHHDHTPKLRGRFRSWRGKLDASEVDLSSAYCTAANKIGAISDMTKQRLLKISKSSRLAAIGSLGTRRIVTEWKNGKQISSTVETEPTRCVWDWIVAEVDYTMNKLANENEGSLFYWADAAFVKRESAQDFRRAAGAEGYGTKTKNVRVYQLRNGAVRVDDGRIFRP